MNRQIQQQVYEVIFEPVHAPHIVDNQLHVLTTERTRHIYDTQSLSLVVYNIHQLSSPHNPPAFITFNHPTDSHNNVQHFCPESRHQPTQQPPIGGQQSAAVAKNLLRQHIDLERQYNAYMAQREVCDDNGTHLSSTNVIAYDSSNLCTQFFVRNQLHGIVENAMRLADDDGDVEMRDYGV